MIILYKHAHKKFFRTLKTVLQIMMLRYFHLRARNNATALWHRKSWFSQITRNNLESVSFSRDNFTLKRTHTTIKNNMRNQRVWQIIIMNNRWFINCRFGCSHFAVIFSNDVGNWSNMIYLPMKKVSPTTEIIVSR